MSEIVGTIVGRIVNGQKYDYSLSAAQNQKMMGQVKKINNIPIVDTTQQNGLGSAGNINLFAFDHINNILTLYQDGTPYRFVLTPYNDPYAETPGTITLTPSASTSFAKAGGSVTVTIATTGTVGTLSVMASPNQDWCTVTNITGNVFTINIAANAGVARDANVTVSGTNAGVESKTLVISQASGSNITGSVSFSGTNISGGQWSPSSNSANNVITINPSGTIGSISVASSNTSWCTVSNINNNVFTISVTENTSTTNSRTATVTVSGENIEDRSIIIVQAKKQVTPSEPSGGGDQPEAQTSAVYYGVSAAVPTTTSAIESGNNVVPSAFTDKVATFNNVGGAKSIWIAYTSNSNVILVDIKDSVNESVSLTTSTVGNYTIKSYTSPSMNLSADHTVTINKN